MATADLECIQGPRNKAICSTYLFIFNHTLVILAEWHTCMHLLTSAILFGVFIYPMTSQVLHLYEEASVLLLYEKAYIDLSYFWYDYLLPVPLYFKVTYKVLYTDKRGKKINKETGNMKLGQFHIRCCFCHWKLLIYIFNSSFLVCELLYLPRV